ncbi:DUF3710 domain-containing protein [Thermomonospora catenispora]|uniref:DUF3710 domain-containing protein n=1 Tax=Thermomonospora catenispora TaxID=2493090 RepID=UPI001122FB6B|nr:DUF3710 domain-containing protein [Thermomonospora catenispora]TNY36436.1 DUF3710 domain-containing protein [Thermomonospora catenispora]
MPIRRRRRHDEESDKNLDVAREQADAVETDDAPAGGAGDATGPWDVADAFPELDRLDFGSLRIPVGPGLAFQVNFEATEVDAQGNPVNGRPVAVLVQHAESVLQIQAFAAPKRSGIWDEVRKEAATEITEQAQGQAEERPGPFGTELMAMVPAQLTKEMLEQMPPEVREQIPQEVIDQGYAWQPVRFIGVDGPRWFLQGVVQGAAVEDEEQWQVLEDVFRNIVVIRGEQPMPPRELLPLSIPKEFTEAAQQAQQAQQGEGGQAADPAERGQEASEVR